MYVFIKILVFHRMKTLLLLSTKAMENICTVIIQIQNDVREIFTKTRDSKSLTLNVSLKMRSCSEIDINILFVFNTKCIYPRGHFMWILHPAKHQELISKVLAKFSFFTNFRRIRILDIVHSLGDFIAGIGNVRHE